MKMTPVISQGIVSAALLFSVLLFSYARGGHAENRAAAPADTKQLLEEAKALENEWAETRKQFRARYEDLIERTGDSIEDHAHALDNGDAKKREEINEEELDLKRSRDDLKRKLAELTAAKTIDVSKIQEEVHDRIEDIKD